MSDPIMPSYIVAQEAYAFLFTKYLEKPDDPERRYEMDCARHLRDAAWEAERQAALSAV